MLNWKFYLFVFIILIFLSSVWGNDDFRRVEIKNFNRKELLSLGMALRQRFYPHLDKNEVKLYMMWNGAFDDQYMLYQSWRMNQSNMSDLSKIKYIALSISNNFDIDTIENDVLREQAEWATRNYHKIVCDMTLSTEWDLRL